MDSRVNQMLQDVDAYMTGAWLVGSCARGSENPSDLDILIEAQRGMVAELMTEVGARLQPGDRVECVSGYTHDIPRVNTTMPLHVIICDEYERELFAERKPLIQ